MMVQGWLDKLWVLHPGEIETLERVRDQREKCVCVLYSIFDGYCSTVQGLLDWFEVDLRFTDLLFIQIETLERVRDQREKCVCVLYSITHVYIYIYVIDCMRVCRACLRMCVCVVAVKCRRLYILR